MSHSWNAVEATETSHVSAGPWLPAALRGAAAGRVNRTQPAAPASFHGAGRLENSSLQCAPAKASGWNDWNAMRPNNKELGEVFMTLHSARQREIHQMFPQAIGLHLRCCVTSDSFICMSEEDAQIAVPAHEYSGILTHSSKLDWPYQKIPEIPRRRPAQNCEKWITVYRL